LISVPNNTIFVEARLSLMHMVMFSLTLPVLFILKLATDVLWHVPVPLTQGLTFAIVGDVAFISSGGVAFPDTEENVIELFGIVTLNETSIVVFNKNQLADWQFVAFILPDVSFA
jgi:hypothetical protein